MQSYCELDLRSIFAVNFSKLFQPLSISTSAGMTLAHARSVHLATAIPRESRDEVDFAVIRFLTKKIDLAHV